MSVSIEVKFSSIVALINYRLFVEFRCRELRSTFDGRSVSSNAVKVAER